jgi:hypothetical protein
MQTMKKKNKKYKIANPITNVGYGKEQSKF